MIILDTDTLTFFFRNHARVVERMQTTTDEVVITIVSRIETLQGRFDTLMKAADGIALQRGQQRLDEAERHLARIPKILPIDVAAAAAFDRLRENKKLKKIGRGDLLINVSRSPTWRSGSESTMFGWRAGPSIKSSAVKSKRNIIVAGSALCGSTRITAIRWTSLRAGPTSPKSAAGKWKMRRSRL